MYRIICKDLRLKCLKKRHAQELTATNRDARLTRAKKLLRLYLQSGVDFIFFSDEKVFTVAAACQPSERPHLRATVDKKARCRH